MSKVANLLIIMSDEHQARAMGCAGHELVKTPNLDALAARGQRFTNAVTPSSICVPARASFATGRYPHQNRLWDNAMPYTGETPGWGHALQSKGVPVESIGKLHYRSTEDPTGFDAEHIPMMVADGVGMIWASIRQEDRRWSPDKRMLGEYIGPGESKYTIYDRTIVDRTTSWFDERAKCGDDRSWCLYVGLVAPHFPLVSPEKFYNLYPHESLPESKLHPNEGYKRHPWVEKQDAYMTSETLFEDADERQRAIAAYYGLCSFLDDNVGNILSALEVSGYGETTTVIYTSDHGDNVGARGLWGKSNMYEESVAVPLIMVGPEVATGVCETPVSLIDISATITDHFSIADDGSLPGSSLYGISVRPDDPERVVFSEYHASGAVSGAFMIRDGRWKYIYYVGFEPELFDLEDDPEEIRNLANDAEYEDIRRIYHAKLHEICDPETIDAQAHADQAALVEHWGGIEAAKKLGAPGATPPPELS